MRAATYILTAIIAALLTLFFTRSCIKPEVVEVTKLDTFYTKGDSFPYVVEVGIPVPYKVDSIIEVPVDIDTAKAFEIVRDYLAKRHYIDTVTDGKFRAIIKDVITQNRIAEREVSFQDLRGQMIIRETVTAPKKNELYLGALSLYDERLRIAPYAMFKSKKGFSVLYGTNTKVHVFGFGVKVGKPP